MRGRAAGGIAVRRVVQAIQGADDTTGGRAEVAVRA